MALQFSSGNEIVDRIGQIDFTMCGAANMLLPSWFKTICYDNGKCNLNACVILSEIVGWYKPTPVKDERTGQILGWKAKFKADLLQKNYQDLGETFGLTKRQASEAVVFLEHMGLIRRELRSVTTESGLTLGNVLFIELIVDRLLEVSFPEEEGTDAVVPPLTLERERGHVIMGEGSRYNVRGVPLERETYTYNTTLDTTSDTTSSSSEKRRTCGKNEEEEEAYKKLIADNICLNDLMQSECGRDRERCQMLYEIMCKVVCSKARTIRINSEDMPIEVAKSVFLKIGYDEIVYVCEKLDEPKEKPIGNLEAYLRTLLYNAHTTQNEHWTQKINRDLSIGTFSKTEGDKEEKTSEYDEVIKMLERQVATK